MADYTVFPIINAALNGTSAVLIVTGRTLIRRGQVTWHRACMISAVVCSSMFLVSYVWYHAHVGSVRFQGQGMVRPVYFAILTSHTLLAVVVVPLVIVTLVCGLRARFDRHRAMARWTYPIWLYVSITGVVIYVMLYHLHAAPKVIAGF